MAAYHAIYVVRARCECGFLWTTPDSDSVICVCGASSILAGVVTGSDLTFTEEEFVAAVALDIGVDLSDMTVSQGS